ncbi:hypothetical protein FVE85_9137 [Porphyridium purpureum]|uniref:Uncharacterized protein n=1 Tax=Porphyridium purpureum TaxID=35688 RepID=A0A5J4YNU3_PORPP|nr:hypothetical protein FVE85_9137 [Porphyridium purpureum]|eukprot:POR2551..scf222_8
MERGASRGVGTRDGFEAGCHWELIDDALHSSHAQKYPTLGMEALMFPARGKDVGSIFVGDDALLTKSALSITQTVSESSAVRSQAFGRFLLRTGDTCEAPLLCVLTATAVHLCDPHLETNDELSKERCFTVLASYRLRGGVAVRALQRQSHEHAPDSIFVLTSTGCWAVFTATLHGHGNITLSCVGLGLIPADSHAKAQCKSGSSSEAPFPDVRDQHLHASRVPEYDIVCAQEIDLVASGTYVVRARVFVDCLTLLVILFCPQNFGPRSICKGKALTVYVGPTSRTDLFRCDPVNAVVHPIKNIHSREMRKPSASSQDLKRPFDNRTDFDDDESDTSPHSWADYSYFADCSAELSLRVTVPCFKATAGSTKEHMAGTFMCVEASFDPAKMAFSNWQVFSSSDSREARTMSWLPGSQSRDFDFGGPHDHNTILFCGMTFFGDDSLENSTGTPPQAAQVHQLFLLEYGLVIDDEAAQSYASLGSIFDHEGAGGSMQAFDRLVCATKFVQQQNCPSRGSHLFLLVFGCKSLGLLGISRDSRQVSKCVVSLTCWRNSPASIVPSSSSSFALYASSCSPQSVDGQVELRIAYPQDTMNACGRDVVHMKILCVQPQHRLGIHRILRNWQAVQRSLLGFGSRYGLGSFETACVISAKADHQALDVTESQVLVVRTHRERVILPRAETCVSEHERIQVEIWNAGRPVVSKRSRALIAPGLWPDLHFCTLRASQHGYDQGVSAEAISHMILFVSIPMLNSTLVLKWKGEASGGLLSFDRSSAMDDMEEIHGACTSEMTLAGSMWSYTKAGKVIVVQVTPRRVLAYALDSDSFRVEHMRAAEQPDLLASSIYVDCRESKQLPMVVAFDSRGIVCFVLKAQHEGNDTLVWEERVVPVIGVSAICPFRHRNQDILAVSVWSSSFENSRQDGRFMIRWFGLPTLDWLGESPIWQALPEKEKKGKRSAGYEQRNIATVKSMCTFYSPHAGMRDEAKCSDVTFLACGTTDGLVYVLHVDELQVRPIFSFRLGVTEVHVKAGSDRSVSNGSTLLVMGDAGQHFAHVRVQPHAPGGSASFSSHSHTPYAFDVERLVPVTQDGFGQYQPTLASSLAIVPSQSPPIQHPVGSVAKNATRSSATAVWISADGVLHFGLVDERQTLVPLRVQELGMSAHENRLDTTMSANVRKVFFDRRLCVCLVSCLDGQLLVLNEALQLLAGHGLSKCFASPGECVIDARSITMRTRPRIVLLTHTSGAHADSPQRVSTSRLYILFFDYMGRVVVQSVRLNSLGARQLFISAMEVLEGEHALLALSAAQGSTSVWALEQDPACEQTVLAVCVDEFVTAHALVAEMVSVSVEEQVPLSARSFLIASLHVNGSVSLALLVLNGLGAAAQDIGCKLVCLKLPDSWRTVGAVQSVRFISPTELCVMDVLGNVLSLAICMHWQAQQVWTLLESILVSADPSLGTPRAARWIDESIGPWAIYSFSSPDLRCTLLPGAVLMDRVHLGIPVHHYSGEEEERDDAYSAFECDLISVSAEGHAELVHGFGLTGGDSTTQRLRSIPSELLKTIDRRLYWAHRVLVLKYAFRFFGLARFALTGLQEGDDEDHDRDGLTGSDHEQRLDADAALACSVLSFPLLCNRSVRVISLDFLLSRSTISAGRDAPCLLQTSLGKTESTDEDLDPFPLMGDDEDVHDSHVLQPYDDLLAFLGNHFAYGPEAPGVNIDHEKGSKDVIAEESTFSFHSK